jgi:DNA polymerase delta subunit 1
MRTPHKRVLADSTNARRNFAVSPHSSKKRKLDSSPVKGLKPTTKSFSEKLGSSQPKSQFEEEVLEKLSQDIHGLKQNNSEKDQQWARPSLADFDEVTDSLCFQQIEAEEGTLGGRPTVRLYGVTEARTMTFGLLAEQRLTLMLQAGHSVMLHVTDFQHYLYVAAPPLFNGADCDKYRAALEANIAMHQPVIQSVKLTQKENLFGFQGNQKSPYLKITVTDPKHIGKVRTLIEKGNVNYRGLWPTGGDGILTFDSIQYILRFMIDCKVGSFGSSLPSRLTFSDIWYVLGRGSAEEISDDSTARSAF